MFYNFAILLPSFTCLFWAIVILSKWRTNYRAQNVVGVALIFAALNTFYFANLLVESQTFEYEYIFNIVVSLSQLLVLPLFVRYFRLLTSTQKLQQWNNVIFLPSIILIGSIIVNHIFMGHDLSVAYTKDMLQRSDFVVPTGNSFVDFQYWLFLVSNVTILLQNIYLIVYSIIAMRRYTTELHNFHSNDANKSVGANYMIVGVFILFFIITAFVIVLPVGLFDHILWFTLLMSFIFTVSMFLLAYCVGQLKYCASDMLIINGLDEQVDENNDSLSPRSYPSTLSSKFNQLIEDKKIFLQPNLSIYEVARQLSTNRIYIYRMLKEQHNKNFYQFINDKRIKYAAALMIAEPEIGEKEVALRSGFARVRNFRNCFKTRQKMSATKWRKINLD